MVTVTGKAVFGGIAVGTIREFQREEKMIEKTHITDIQAELLRFEAARVQAASELRTLYDKAVTEVGEDNAAIFEMHQVMLEDENYLSSVKTMIETQEINAEAAVAATSDIFVKLFTEMKDSYVRERAVDIRDISERLRQILSQHKQDISESGIVTDDGQEPYIIVADDLTPSETIQLDKSKVLAFVMRYGSINSHTAILARSMNIPALVCTPLDREADRKLAIVDGDNGTVILEPGQEVLEKYQRIWQQEQERRKLLLQLKGRKTVTKQGKEIKLYANIGSVEDAKAALANDAAGIGLFRSEFLYLQGNTYPTQEEQFQAYKTVAELMKGKKVIIRTLDIGADKQPAYFGLEKEENPAMGFRAVRICLERPEILKTQLRAIYRASVYGNIAMMIPMITAVWEVRRIKEICAEVRKELKECNAAFTDVQIGIMIETPAAVMIAQELAAEVDFFSIGTNDLMQYALAVDRQNARLDLFYDAHHPALLRMIKLVADSAHRAGIEVGICGELAADTALTESFLQIGIDELSVSPAFILPVRDRILHIDL